MTKEMTSNEASRVSGSNDHRSRMMYAFGNSLNAGNACTLQWAGTSVSESQIFKEQRKRSKLVQKQSEFGDITSLEYDEMRKRILHSMNIANEPELGATVETEKEEVATRVVIAVTVVVTNVLLFVSRSSLLLSLAPPKI